MNIYCSVSCSGLPTLADHEIAGRSGKLFAASGITASRVGRRPRSGSLIPFLHELLGKGPVSTLLGIVAISPLFLDKMGDGYGDLSLSSPLCRRDGAWGCSPAG